MKTKKYKNICRFGITFLIVILFFTSLDYNKSLKGSHLFQNIIGDGQYTFCITPSETDFYTFRIDDFNKNATYEVYNTQNDSLISQGSIGYTSEGYRPFIEISLENSITYKVNLTLVDKNTFSLAHIKLCE